MEIINISHLQKNCNAILEKVNHLDESVLICRKGKFLAKTVPLSFYEKKSWLGCMAGTGRIVGDITSPAETLSVGEDLTP
jgi:hypothetical protein